MSDISLRIETPKTAYPPGEPIPLTLVIENPTDHPATWQFRSGQQFDFAATDSEGHEIWRWSHGRAFTMAFTTLTLPPGESRRFDITWKPNTPPGAYTITAWLPIATGNPPTATGLPVRIAKA